MSSSFFELPLDTDVADETDDALARIAQQIDGWVPREGHIEVAVIEEIVRASVETRQVAVDVAAAIFREFGRKLVGIAPVDAAPATVETTWTAVDDAGYTIPSGALVGFQVSGDELVLFETTGETTIAPGATEATDVTVVAVEAGAAANDLAAQTLQLVQPTLTWVDSVASTSTTSGGIDAESDDAYLDRLAAELQLLTPRPILPDDFEVLARRTEGVWRARAVDGHDPGTDEVQTVEVTDATGGTFTLTFDGQTTAAIAFDATAADIQTALEALSNIDPGDVDVTDGPVNTTGGVTVTFDGQYESTDVAEMTADGANLTGGGTVTVTTDTGGVAASDGNERVVTVVPVDEDGKTVSQTVKDNLDADLEARREVNFVVHIDDPDYTAIAVDYTAVADDDADTSEVQEAVNAAVRAHIDPATWAGGAASPPRWDSVDEVRYLDVAHVILAVDGVNHLDALTVNGGTADVALAGVAPLPAPFDDPTPSTVTGSVT